MGGESHTQEAGTFLSTGEEPHAFLVLHVDGTERSRVVDLPDGVDVTFGRSRGAAIHIDNEKMSRMHARIRRSGTDIVVEDLGSRNGTRVNGTRIEGTRRLASGDEIALGPIVAIVGVASALRRTSTIADDQTGLSRLAAEVDRSVRYQRPLAVALVRVADDAVIDAMARALRPMDLMAEDVGDDYLVILPELGPAECATTVTRLLDLARGAGIDARAEIGRAHV